MFPKALCAAILFCCCSFTGPAAAARGADVTPNFLLIVVDDLGFMDIGANNPQTFYSTPNIDRLARSGTRFTQSYSTSPVCSPSRYSLLTGRYPVRSGMTNVSVPPAVDIDRRDLLRSGFYLGADFARQLPAGERTIAETLRDHGYRTSFLGKWHLGFASSARPDQRGFDLNVAGNGAGGTASYFAPFSEPGSKADPDAEYLPAYLTTAAIELLDDYAQDTAPFFMMLAYYAVHTPLEAPQVLVEDYARKSAASGAARFGTEEQIWILRSDAREVRLSQNHAVYAAMVTAVDQQIGRLLDALEANGQLDDTVIVFTSDNGGLSISQGTPTANTPLRAGKGWLYEGGIRVPLIVADPREPRATVTAAPVSGADIYPTLLQLAGLPAMPRQHLDGRGLLPLLTGQEADSARALFWHFPHYSNEGGFPGGAIRQGRFKFVQRYDTADSYLFDLESDPGETQDIATLNPDRTRQLRDRLLDWYSETDARFLRRSAIPFGRRPWLPDAAQ